MRTYGYVRKGCLVHGHGTRPSRPNCYSREIVVSTAPCVSSARHERVTRHPSHPSSSSTALRLDEHARGVRFAEVDQEVEPPDGYTAEGELVRAFGDQTGPVGQGRSQPCGASSAATPAPVASGPTGPPTTAGR
jgi:hypothetical protein